VNKFAFFATLCGVMFTASFAQAAGPGPGNPTLTLHFLEIQTSFATTFSQFSQRPKLGDRVWFHSELYRWNGGKRGAHAGHTDGTVVILTPNLGEVDAVGYLPGGTLTVAGQSHNQRTDTFAIVGGTGAFATARGEVIVRSIGNPNGNKSSDTIRIWL